MNMKQWMIPLSTFVMFGVAGCANNTKQAEVNASNQNMLRSVGYYSNENHRNNGNPLFSDNDGAITEIMDHTFGAEGKIINDQKRRQLLKRDENGNPKNPTTPLAASDRNFFLRDDRFSTSDINYHGHLNKDIGNTGVATNPKFQDHVTKEIRNTVANINNVQAVRSVAYGNTVIVSVKLNDKSKAAATKQAIETAVKPYAFGKSVTVLWDEGAIGSDGNIHNDIQLNMGGK